VRGGARSAPACGAAKGLSHPVCERRRGRWKPNRWLLWLPVRFAGGIVAYFALADEPGPRLAAALLLGASGLCLAFRHVPLGLCLGDALLAFASGFGAAKLRTELTRAPVLAHELRYISLAGFIESHERRDKGRARLRWAISERMSALIACA
jgi:competence protein ComEC